MLWHWSRHTLPVSVRGAGLFFCCGFCCCGSVVFRVAFLSELALYGRILLHFRTPKEGYSACICVIRSTSTTRCDDLAEATGAQDGKKIAQFSTVGDLTRLAQKRFQRGFLKLVAADHQVLNPYLILQETGLGDENHCTAIVQKATRTDFRWWFDSPLVRR